MFEQSRLLVDILDAVELLQFIFLQSKWGGNGRDRRKDRLEVGPDQKDKADVKEYQQKSRLDRWFHRDDAKLDDIRIPAPARRNTTTMSYQIAHKSTRPCSPEYNAAYENDGYN